MRGNTAIRYKPHRDKEEYKRTDIHGLKKAKESRAHRSYRYEPFTFTADTLLNIGMRLYDSTLQRIVKESRH